MDNQQNRDGEPSRPVEENPKSPTVGEPERQTEQEAAPRGDGDAQEDRTAVGWEGQKEPDAVSSTADETSDQANVNATARYSIIVTDHLTQDREKQGGSGQPNTRAWQTPGAKIVLGALIVAALAVILLLLATRRTSPVPKTGEDIAGRMAARYESDTRPAAYVGEATITEGAATARIMTFRVSNGLEDEPAWHGWLTMQGMTPESMRSSMLERLVVERVVREEAAKMEIEISDEQLAAQIEKNRASYLAQWAAEDPASLDERWRQATSYSQVDGMSYEEHTRELLLEAEIAKVVAGEGMTYAEWLESQLAARTIEYLDPPADLPYLAG